MIFPSGLKRVCDISFYMTFASIAGNLFGGDNLISTLPIFVFFAFLSAFLAPRGRIKYISVILLFLVFVTTPFTIINVAILIPAILFMIRTFPKPDEQVSQFHYAGVFKLFLLIFSWFVILTIVLGGAAHIVFELPSDTLLFAISFLLSSIVFMRLVRHDESVLTQTQFKIMNTISVVGIMVGAVLLSMDRFLIFAGRMINFIFLNFLAPVLDFVIWIVLTILQFILRAIRLDIIVGDTRHTRFQLAIELPMPSAEMQELYEEVQEGSGLPNIFTFIIAVLLIFLAIQVFKMLTKLRPPFSSDHDVEEERFSLDDEARKKRRFRRRNESQVREVYRRFLVLLKKKEVNVPLHLTSDEIEDLVVAKFDSEKSSDLRDEYIRVRYREDTCTDDDVKRIKGLYKEIKEEIARFKL